MTDIGNCKHPSAEYVGYGRWRCLVCDELYAPLEQKEDETDDTTRQRPLLEPEGKEQVLADGAGAVSADSSGESGTGRSADMAIRPDEPVAPRTGKFPKIESAGLRGARETAKQQLAPQPEQEGESRVMRTAREAAERVATWSPAKQDYASRAKVAEICLSAMVSSRDQDKLEAIGKIYEIVRPTPSGEEQKEALRKIIDEQPTDPLAPQPEQEGECNHAWQKIPPPAFICPKCWSIRMDGTVTVKRPNAPLAASGGGEKEVEDGQRRIGSNPTDSPAVGSVGRVAGEQVADNLPMDRIDNVARKIAFQFDLDEDEYAPIIAQYLVELYTPQPEQEGECNHYFAQDGICIYCHAPLAASGGGEERRQGHSKLVYNKQTRTIDTVDPHPSPQGNDRLIERAEHWASVSVMGAVTGPLFNELIAALAAAEKRAKDYADLYMDRCEKWSALKETLATKEKQIAELREGLKALVDDYAPNDSNIGIWNRARSLLGERRG